MRSDCEGCCHASVEQPDAGATRREFLRGTVGCLTGVVASLGLDVLPVHAISGAGQAQEKRYSIPSGDSVNVDRDAQVILVRDAGHVYVLSLACPHQNAAVRWLPGDLRFQCTKHDSRYRPDGTYMSGRATRNLDRFPIKRDGASVVVDVTKVFRSDQEAAGWAAASLQV
jgi:Rieske Fe-S protein